MRSGKLKKIMAVALALIFVLGSFGLPVVLGISSLSGAGKVPPVRMKLKNYPVRETDVYGDWPTPAFTRKDAVYEHIDPSAFTQAKETFLTALGLDPAQPEAAPSRAVDNDTFRKAADDFLALFDKASRMAALNQIAYSHDVTDTHAKEEMTYMETLMQEGFNVVLTALQSVQNNKTLGKTLDDYLGPERAKDLRESKIITGRRMELSKEITKLEQQFDNLDKNATYEEKGDIYLKLIKLRNETAAEEGYKNYPDYNAGENDSRDFNEQDIERYYAAVKKYITPLYMRLASMIDWDALEQYTYPPGETAESLVRGHVGNISSELLQTFDYLENADLLYWGDTPNTEDVSYTISLPGVRSGMIFIKEKDDYNNLTTLIHEFGHFNTAVRDTRKSFFAKSDIDLAEIHSQGLELLFMPYAEELYGPDAQSARGMLLLNMVWAVLTGCLYNEFESYAYSTPDVTLDQLSRKYMELSKAYLGETDRKDGWMFWHIYHSPLYYISYSYSAMASLTLLLTLKEDPDRTIQNYLTLTSFGESTYPFRETLKKSSLPDIFETDTIRKAAGAILDWTVDPMIMTPEGPLREPDGQRPGISLPEYGTKPARPDEDPNDPSYGVNIWDGRPGLSAEDIAAAIPRAVVYILSGRIWQDLMILEGGTP